jgi:hypothetical protein
VLHEVVAAGERVAASVPIPQPGTEVGAPKSAFVNHVSSWLEMARERIELKMMRRGREEKVSRAASCKTGQF